LVFITCGVCGAAEKSALRVLEYDNDRLTIHAHAVPINDLLSEIGRKSGAEVRGVCEVRDVSAEFDAEPLAGALERLLGQQNSFALRYGPDGALRVIELLPPTSTTPVFNLAVTRADEAMPTVARDPGFPGLTPSFAPTSAAALMVAERAERHDKHGGRAEHGRGGGRGNMPQMLGALQSAMASQQADQQPQGPDDLQQRMRRTFLNSLRGMDDASLAAYMETPEGQRAATLLQYYAAHHMGSTSQQKADGILSRLPAPPTAIKH
jgi:hypothetical protein